MPECKYDWPAADDRHLIGTRISRIDGPAKSSGRAKYTLDINLPGMLFGKMVTCPYAHAKVTSVDTSAAEKMPGVRAVQVIQGPGKEIQWAGDEVVEVVADTEEQAEDAVRAVKVQYEQLPFLVNEAVLSKAQSANRAAKPSATTQGDPEKVFNDPDMVVSEGEYGIPVIVHCCLEPHGHVVQWTGPQNMRSYSSSQGVSVYPAQFAEALNIPASNVQTICQYIGGGFGSKFSIDRWGVTTAQLAKQTGKPVKYLLQRSHEVEVAGCRPSGFARIKVAAKKDGTLTAWESDCWGTGGPAPSRGLELPYVLRDIPNYVSRFTSVGANIGPARAWRAPNHPQQALLTMSALDDLAAKLNMDPVEFFSKNADLAPQNLGKVYREELQKAAELAEWSKYWHPRGDKTPGHIKRGLGVSIHTWGGRGHASNCQLTIEPDGSVTAELASQDLGTGTRTVIAIVAADTLGLPVEGVTVRIGDSHYPYDGPSGGSTTVGGVSSSTRRAAVDARDQLFAAVAPALSVPADQLAAAGGRIQAKGDSSKSLTWKQACQKLGMKRIQTHGKNPGPCPDLISSGVGGAQIADVSVDTETGMVKINRMTAAQDCGLIIDMKTAESQVYGALIMGIGYALFEEKIMDNVTGRMLNPNMEFYKLAGIGDIGELKVHMMTGPGYDERGVIGLGEPPVISPGAAISNAVANALGARVPSLPLSPDKVLAAIQKGGMA
ncbi:MAG TPA: xanthine dehydrogenase family protein molybdopterin-binding subunit [Terriglobia bacterium]|nr:xanthine dehydrogenase family protein molybdopterin-binding subunit [Terriglobia bacterium]